MCNLESNQDRGPAHLLDDYKTLIAAPAPLLCNNT